MKYYQKILYYSKLYLTWKTGYNENEILPEDISIELTNRCNFQCSYCVHSDANYRKNIEYTELELRELEYLLKQTRDVGIKTSTLHFTLGGEPLLYSKLNEAFKLAYDYGFKKIIFSSNGVLLTSKFIENLFVKDDLHYDIWIDYCANKNYFENVRGFKGSWEIINKNIKSYLKNNFKHNLTLNLTDISNFNNTNKKYTINEYRKMKGLFKTNKHLRYHRRTFHNATGFLSKKYSKRQKAHICPHPWASLVFGSNGDIVACSRDITHKTVLGNAFKTPLTEIMQSSTYKNFKRNHRMKNLNAYDACKNCDLPYDNSKMNLKHYVYTFFNRLGGF